MLFTLAL